MKPTPLSFIVVACRFCQYLCRFCRLLSVTLPQHGVSTSNGYANIQIPGFLDFHIVSIPTNAFRSILQSIYCCIFVSHCHCLYQKNPILFFFFCFLQFHILNAFNRKNNLHINFILHLIKCFE